jgi:protein SCO1
MDVASTFRLTLVAFAIRLSLATAAAIAQDRGPMVDQAWARATLGAVKVGAAYIRIISPVDDRLISLATPVAGKVELHTHVQQDGVMRMQAVEGGLVLRANQIVQLRPGGPMHIMLIDLNRTLTAGESFPLTLGFEKAGSREVTVKVERLGAMGPTASPPASPAPRQANLMIGGPFTLIDQDGRLVSDLQFHGRWLLVYFGYTHCPDVCPTALSDMAAALADLDPVRRARIAAVFITVDPQRDTPSVMKEYVGAFEEANILGLSGSPEQVQQAEAAYRVRAKRYDRKDGDYSMSHASAIHIMDPGGQFVTLAPPEKIAERLAQLVP